MLIALFCFFAFSITSLQAEPNKDEPLHQWHFAFGPAFLNGMNSTGTGLGVEAARFWNMDAVVLKLGANFLIKGPAYLGTFGIGADYAFLPGATSPYVGADFGVGFAKTEGDGLTDGGTNGGFVLGLEAGTQFFRNATVNLDIGLRAILLIRDTSTGTPIGYLFKVGLNF